MSVDLGIRYKHGSARMMPRKRDGGPEDEARWAQAKRALEWFDQHVESLQFVGVGKFPAPVRICAHLLRIGRNGKYTHRSIICNRYQTCGMKPEAPGRQDYGFIIDHAQYIWIGGAPFLVTHPASQPKPETWLPALADAGLQAKWWDKGHSWWPSRWLAVIGRPDEMHRLPDGGHWLVP